MQRLKDRQRGKWLVFPLVGIAAVAILAALFLWSFSPESSAPRAAIIDQLSSSHLSPSSRHKNPALIEEAKELLGERFSEVDYYCDNATIYSYAALPSKGYKLIIWRVHSALDVEGGFTAICSAEGHDPEKYSEYSPDQLTLCNITHDMQLYFAITPKFIAECMTGRFEDTIIILMTCNGLNHEYLETARALVERGAEAIISWSGWIDSGDSDNATSQLLNHMIAENNTVREAVEKIDNYYTWGFCWLDYYPQSESAGNLFIHDYRGCIEATAQNLLPQSSWCNRNRTSFGTDIRAVRSCSAYWCAFAEA